MTVQNQSDLGFDIAKVVAMYRNGQDEDEMFRSLTAGGMSIALAEKLIGFVPMAYCYAVLRESGVTFPQTFRRRLANGNLSDPYDLKSEPVWNAAVAFAMGELERRVSYDEIIWVAGRSAEMQTINNQMNRGLELHQIVLIPSTLPSFSKGK